MIKILSIGNSFSQDAQRYVHQIAENQGAEIECVNLFVSGCSLEMHWENWLQDAPAYWFETNGQWNGAYISMSKALSMQKWDYVTLQQASFLSPNYNTYMPYLKDLAEQVRMYAPTAKILMHQTWAYVQGWSRMTEKLGYLDQHDMLRDIQIAYAKAAETIGAAGIIPSGEAMMNALDMGIDNIHRDHLHAHNGIGRYTIGLAWYMTLTGDMDIRSHIPLDEPAEERELKIAVEAARKAVTSHRMER